MGKLTLAQLERHLLGAAYEYLIGELADDLLSGRVRICVREEAGAGTAAPASRSGPSMPAPAPSANCGSGRPTPIRPEKADEIFVSCCSQPSQHYPRMNTSDRQIWSR